MLSLNTRLGTIGISAAKGVDLVMQRDQIQGTLPTPVDSKTEGSANARSKSAESKAAPARHQLTPEQQRQVEELGRIDRKVRAHEQAHISTGGELVKGGPSYAYTYGPDGKQYATSGEVDIDTSPEKEPEANIDKGQRIRATALAPSDPSPQDYRVASVGGQLEAQGYSDLMRARREEQAAAQQPTEAEAARRRVEDAYGDTATRAASSRLSAFA